MKRRARWLSWIFCRRTTHEPRRLIYHSVGSSQGNCHLRQICEKSKKRKSCKVVYFKMGAPMTWPPHLSHWFLLIEAFGSPWSSTSVIAPWITGRPDAHIVLTLSGQPFHFFLLQKWKWIWLKLSFQIQKPRFSFCFFVVSGFSLLQFAKAFCSHAFIEETDAS